MQQGRFTLAVVFIALAFLLIAIPAAAQNRAPAKSAMVSYENGLTFEHKLFSSISFSEIRGTHQINAEESDAFYTAMGKIDSIRKRIRDCDYFEAEVQGTFFNKSKSSSRVMILAQSVDQQTGGIHISLILDLYVPAGQIVDLSKFMTESSFIQLEQHVRNAYMGGDTVFQLITYSNGTLNFETSGILIETVFPDY